MNEPYEAPDEANERMARALADAEMDIEWILSEPISVIKVKGTYLVVERGPQNRCCVISTSPEGRMLYDGEDIETEDYMAYIGLLDAVEEAPTGEAVMFAAGE